MNTNSKRLNVVLIAPPLLDYVADRLEPIAMDSRRTNPPYGLYMLAAILREKGHDVVLADLIAQGSPDLDRFAGALAEADLLGIGTTTLAWPAARDCIRQIRKLSPKAPIVLGGIHATMFDHYLLEHFEIDFVIRGEGEVALPMLCEALCGDIPFDNVPNLTLKTKEGKIVRNSLAPLLAGERLAEFSFPDYSQIPEGYAGLGLESSRGCPFNCSFCSTSYRSSWRKLPVQAFVDRVELAMNHLSRTSYGYLHITDDEFSVDCARAVEICRELGRRRLKPKLIFNARANDILNIDFTDAISEYAHEFLIGAECGYDEGLRRVGKGTTTAKITEAARVLSETGISGKACFSFVIGLPWETKDEVLQTVNFACGLYARYGVQVLLQWYCQIPGSRLWDEAQRKGIVSPAFYDDYGFFQDIYLFRTGVALTPTEIFKITETLDPIVKLSLLKDPDSRMVQYSHPWPILKYYPPKAQENIDIQGLGSLRQVRGVKRVNESIARN
ncbi:MAG: radical SAM protein [Acidobacteriota bacterium]|nr:radical SAM protein [Acidobacteriota bacterium]